MGKFFTKSCYAYNCPVKKREKSEVTLHKFPRDPECAKEWVKFARNPLLHNRPLEKLSKSAFLCQNHFRDDQYLSLTPRKLVPGALPTIPSFSEETVDFPESEETMEACIGELPPDSPSSPQEDTGSNLLEPVMNCCRLCSSMTSDSVPIFGEDGVNMKLAYKINKCLPIMVSLSDKLPHHVCKQCVSNLDSTHKFITKCLRNQFILERKLRGKEDIPTDEVSVLWSNVNPELTDVSLADPQEDSTSLNETIEENHSQEVDSISNCEATNIPVTSNECETVTEIEYSENSVENLRSGNHSGLSEHSEDSSDVIFLEKTINKSMENQAENSYSFVSSRNDISGNKENDMVSEQRTNLSQFAMSRRQRKHICKYCNSSFNWKAELFYHQTTSHSDRVFRCRFCLKVFYDSSEEYFKHVSAHKITNAPQLSKKQLASSELNILKQNISLGLQYKSIVEEIIPPPKKEIKKVDESPEKTKERSEIYKSMIDAVVKHLIEEKTGGKVSNDDESGEASRTYKCEWCYTSHQNKEAYYLHLRFQHKLRLPCRFCPRTFCDRRHFIMHEASHKEKKKPKCRKCKIEFETVVEWKEHKKLHFQEKPHVCKLCGEKFNQLWDLRQHSRIHREEKTCLCHKCGKSFRFKTSLRMHVRSCGVDPEMAKKNICRFCGKRYLLPSLLRVHERIHTGEKPFMCSLCGKRFHSNERLKAHSLSHVVENVPCHICGFVLKHSKDLKGHLKSHERVQCKTCGLWFEGSRKLGCHQRVHRKPRVVSEDKQIVMVSKGSMEEDCSSESQMLMRFPVVIELEPHQDIHIAEVQEEVDSQAKIFHCLDKPYECPHCPKKFVLYQSYMKHIQIHSDSKPLYCPECGGKFLSMDDLVSHYYTHLVGNKYFCEICGESFEDEMTMIEHKRAHETNDSHVGDTLLRKRLLMLQPLKAPLVIPACEKTDDDELAFQQVENHVVIGNPDCDGGEYLAFDSHSVDSHCSEVIVVSTTEEIA